MLLEPPKLILPYPLKFCYQRRYSLSTCLLRDQTAPAPARLSVTRCLVKMMKSTAPKSLCVSRKPRKMCEMCMLMVSR